MRRYEEMLNQFKRKEKRGRRWKSIGFATMLLFLPLAALAWQRNIDGVATLILLGIAVGGWLTVKGSKNDIRTATESTILYQTISTRTFEWFKENHPEHYSNGAITCPHCGSGKISFKSIRRGTYTRAHFCSQCGNNLYYSPEVITDR